MPLPEFPQDFNEALDLYRKNKNPLYYSGLVILVVRTGIEPVSKV